MIGALCVPDDDLWLLGVIDERDWFIDLNWDSFIAVIGSSLGDERVLTCWEIRSWF